MSGKFEPPQLSQKLRECADRIASLLEEYRDLRYGDKDWREGKVHLIVACPKCGYKRAATQKEETVEVKCKCGETMQRFYERVGTPPKITVTSSPSRIFHEDEEDDDEGGNQPKIPLNPLFKTAIALGEMTVEEARRMELEKRYSILTDLGIDEWRDCSSLVEWLRKLAAELTYILESREMYSYEIKAAYPELLTNIETALGTCAELSYILGKQDGRLTKRQYNELLIKLLQYTEMARQAALQLADYHQEFMGATAASPFETEASEVLWVLEKEEKKPREIKEFVEEEEEKEKGKT